MRIYDEFNPLDFVRHSELWRIERMKQLRDNYAPQAPAPGISHTATPPKQPIIIIRNHHRYE